MWMEQGLLVIEHRTEIADNLCVLPNIG